MKRWPQAKYLCPLPSCTTNDFGAIENKIQPAIFHCKDRIQPVMFLIKQSTNDTAEKHQRSKERWKLPWASIWHRSILDRVIIIFQPALAAFCAIWRGENVDGEDSGTDTRLFSPASACRICILPSTATFSKCFVKLICIRSHLWIFQIIWSVTELTWRVTIVLQEQTVPKPVSRVWCVPVF